MSDLEIEGSFDEQWGIVKAAVKQHNAAIHGNGQPGLLDFMSSMKGQMRLIIALLLFLSTLAAVGTMLIMIKSARVGELVIPGVTYANPNDPVLSFERQPNQRAGDAPAYIQSEQGVR